MCGIVAGVAERNIVPILLEGLKRLEYRGYDSAGLAVCHDTRIERCRSVGKVASLITKVKNEALSGHSGIAHTRWATHGIPNETNAHPHMSGGRIAVVHNGIIENYQEIRDTLQTKGYTFSSDTDTETIAHLIDSYYRDNQDLLSAVQKSTSHLRGAYAIAVIAANRPDEIIVARHGSPMIIGLGIGEVFAASDIFALLPVTRRFINMQENDLARITKDSYQIYDITGNPVTREINESEQTADMSGKGGYKHYMQKEIFEQPTSIADTLEGRLAHGALHFSSFHPELLDALKHTHQIHIIACGTSYHAGLVMRYHFEKNSIPTTVEYASEYLYREIAVPEKTLFISLSQSGETADTLAALEKAKQNGRYLDTLAICNVPESALTRAANHTILTRAGREIGVASTKAFVTQLVVLHLVNATISQLQERPYNKSALEAFDRLPRELQNILALEHEIAQAAKMLEHRHGCLYIGRGENYPIAAEGALKLKELTYIHAEAHAAGELKHGPLALVDENMPVIALIKYDVLTEKVISNLEVVQARGGQLIIFADTRVDMHTFPNAHIIRLGELEDLTAAITSVVPLQLFAYHVALLKGTDVDQPRNLAKSVTVE
ncbi:MAG: glutamine--fructose-6-phosphate transaminase (isomerizing) [Cardiobacteriaceae bacterium]|nr:glutamine--fructose-6-phosphate transaminase (isomerizing) [Cardiobacteriaceae bacterium]